MTTITTTTTSGTTVIINKFLTSQLIVMNLTLLLFSTETDKETIAVDSRTGNNNQQAAGMKKWPVESDKP